ncbi:helix-turn-helix domain-containing protein [Nocardia sp. NPDC051981]|uniref:helix-turn-helix domain-containing protein n=1 Tax=Nocardia sp. NPDC051981 TaxID=3155417 RepID=UPI00342998DD
MKQSEASQAIGCSQPKIVAMEAGKYLQQPDGVTALLRLYRADVAQIDRLASSHRWPVAQTRRLGGHRFPRCCPTGSRRLSASMASRGASSSIRR